MQLQNSRFNRVSTIAVLLLTAHPPLHTVRPLLHIAHTVRVTIHHTATVEVPQAEVTTQVPHIATHHHHLLPVNQSSKLSELQILLQLRHKITILKCKLRSNLSRIKMLSCHRNLIQSLNLFKNFRIQKHQTM